MRYFKNVLHRRSKSRSKVLVLQYIQADNEGAMWEVANIFDDGTADYMDGRKGFISLEGLDMTTVLEPWAWPDGELSGQMFECTESEYFAIVNLVKK